MARTFSERILQYGSDVPTPVRRTLRAGRLTAELENGDLRYIRFGKVELVRRVYVAVRDHNWDTIKPVISEMKGDDTPDSFQITFKVEHRERDVNFTWRGTIKGDATGKITYAMEGAAVSTFMKNRIGICVLHPDSAAGAAVVVDKVDGTVESGAFPRAISPHQPFKEIRALTHEAAPGVKAKVMFEGETFEMEDQRNWTDGSFKTYSTPLNVKFPAEITAGTKINHTVTVSVDAGAKLTVARRSDDKVVIELGTKRYPIPEIGLGLASHGMPLTPKQTARLRALKLSHLRADIDLTKPGWEAPLLQVHEQAHAIGASVQVGLTVSDAAEQQLAAVAKFFEARPGLLPEWRIFFVFHSGEKATSSKWVELAQKHLAKYAPTVRFGGGTRHYFTELNRNRPGAPVPPWTTWSINPQVHAFDNLSMVETLATQAEVVRSARSFLAGDTKIAVGPITLKPRSNPNATSPSVAGSAIAASADPRQMSLFCAGWMVASIKHLTQAGANSLTYFETTGPSGIMETETGSPAGGSFYSVPDGTFPVFYALADIGMFQTTGSRGEAREVTSASPLEVECAAFARSDGLLRVLVVNLSPAYQDVEIRGLAKSVVAMIRLDSENCQKALAGPEGFWLDRVNKTPEKGLLELTVPPFAVVRVDQDTSKAK